eukprot:TRINITY_DN10755_c1_g1_i1.p1 TRINITY_DN10755_c1_g1~~TRINITY_DN10755_c1_g1_i1.p1  ORF type:complete len:878 (+),score=162.05 TRINITY_DN10755_c1_g1_i1:65-2698(+)
MVAERPPEGAAGTSKAPPAVAHPDDPDVSSEVYLGVVKSYNDRRGFGFLACTETANQYGRDVYMPKAEATLAALQAAGVDRDTGAAMVASGNTSAAAAAAAAAAIGGGPEAAKAAAAAAAQPAEGEKAPLAPRLAEEDLVLFRVRRSVEGYPQGVCVLRLRKLPGRVVRPPADGALGAIDSHEAIAACGQREVPYEAADAGQVRLKAGDEVSFCLPEARAGIDGAGQPPQRSTGRVQAKMISLTISERSNGSVLGCFTLDLPRTRSSPEGEGGQLLPERPNLKLPCHAFGDKLILAGLPPDLDEAELMRFFSKQGATGTIVAHARACSFASVSFQGTADVARFLGRPAHAYADDKDTLIARLLPLAPGSEDSATLPALPSPILSAKPPEVGKELEPGSLLVTWSPLVLAVAYSVELRPSGSGVRWATVDVASRRLGSSSNRFDSNCSSCRVTGLQLNTAYEARVSYFTECGTSSEASEASEPCMPFASVPNAAPRPAPSDAPLTALPEPAPAAAPLHQSGLGAAEGFNRPASAAPPPFGGVPGHGYGAPPPGPMPGVPPGPPHWGAWGPESYAPPLGPGLLPPPLPPPVPMHELAPGVPMHDPAAGGGGYGAPPSWRMPSGLVVPPPATPELRPADEFGFAVSVQWPAVLQAAAYVVELREAGTAAFERFVRSAPEAKLGTLVELRVGGLRPGPPPGRVYMAQVRTVGADGSESLPSPPGWSPPLPSVEAGCAPAAAGAGERPLLSTAGGALGTSPMEATPPKLLSADAIPWQPPGMAEPKLEAPGPAPCPGPGPGNWVPPPWLASQPLEGTSEAPGGPSWGTLGVPPPPPAGPPALRGSGPPAPSGAAAMLGEQAADGASQGGSAAASQQECLILD